MVWQNIVNTQLIPVIWDIIYHNMYLIHIHFFTGILDLKQNTGSLMQHLYSYISQALFRQQHISERDPCERVESEGDMVEMAKIDYRVILWLLYIEWCCGDAWSHGNEGRLHLLMTFGPAVARLVGGPVLFTPPSPVSAATSLHWRCPNIPPASVTT